MKDITIKLTSKGYGRDTYEVTGNVDRYTDEQLMDRCDKGNFGGYVRGRSAERATVVVYTD